MAPAGSPSCGKLPPPLSIGPSATAHLIRLLPMSRRRVMSSAPGLARRWLRTVATHAQRHVTREHRADSARGLAARRAVFCAPGGAALGDVGAGFPAPRWLGGGVEPVPFRSEGLEAAT